MSKTKTLSKTGRDHLITYGMVIIIYIVVEILLHAGLLNNQMQGLLVPVCYYSICAVALNLCVGILGELSLGHAGFMCVGAFASAIWSYQMQSTSMPAGLRFFIAFLIGIAAAMIIGVIIGIPVLRLDGDYLAIVTLAFGEIIKNLNSALFLGIDSKGIHMSLKSAIYLNLEDGVDPIVNGAQGIAGTPRDANFTIAVIVLLISLFVVQNLIDSRDGRAIMAIRDNRIAAEATGINITKYKMLAFVISAGIAGAAGVLYSHNISTLVSQSQYFGYNVSILILVYVVLGGIGNMRGSVIATAILYILPELLRGLNKYRMFVYSIVLIVMMLLNWAPAAVMFRKKLFARFRKNENTTEGGHGNGAA
ncbi:MAG: branched-chain amino acid ABC transporter permease [Eubacteriales bacterium]|jgi:branched-chain amino acid transport system permease protein